MQQHCPISISSSKTSLVSGGVEKSASYSTIATTIKNKVETAAAPNSTFTSQCDDKTNIMIEDKVSTQKEILEGNFHDQLADIHDSKWIYFLKCVQN